MIHVREADDQLFHGIGGSYRQGKAERRADSCSALGSEVSTVRFDVELGNCQPARDLRISLQFVEDVIEVVGGNSSPVVRDPALDFSACHGFLCPDSDLTPG